MLACVTRAVSCKTAVPLITDEMVKGNSSLLEFWCALRIECRAVHRGAPRCGLRRVGMGPRRAERFAARLDSRPPPEEVLSGEISGRLPNSGAFPVVIGLGGASSDAFNVGDVVVATEVRRFPSTNIFKLSTLFAQRVSRLLGDAGLKAVCGPIATSDKPVTGESRHSLAEEGVLAVDTESWWLMQAPHPPLIIIRVILDTPGAELRSPFLPFRLPRCLRALTAAATVLEAQAALLVEAGLGKFSPEGVSPVSLSASLERER